jgi:hypothetical protein
MFGGKELAADTAPQSASPASAIAVWDTAKPSAAPLEPQALADKAGWQQIPTSEKRTSFEGDAVFGNGPIMAVLRKNGAGVVLHAQSQAGAVARLDLRLMASSGELAERLERVALVENTKAGACLEATYQTAKGTSVSAKFRLKRGEVFLQVEPGSGAGQLRVDCRSRFVVLPDFFADDILIDAHKLPPDTVELPSENFLLQLAGKGDSITACVFENRKQDAKVTLTGTGDERTITGSEIGFEGKKVWVGLLEGPQIWYTVDIKPEDAGEVQPLEWNMPFFAQWRVDFTRPNGLTDSWDMLLAEKKGKGYIKPSWLGSGPEHLGDKRHRWNTVLGSYPYPCWADVGRKGYLQPLKNKALSFQGPAVIYPINRVQETPLPAYTVMDVMRNTLGVGPCQYILDLEGQKAEYRGRATCSCRDELAKIYGKGKQKEERARVEKILDDGLIFVKHIRSRITRYVEFGHRMRAYLADQEKSHPELSGFLNDMGKLAQEIDTRVAARADKIQTPDHVAAMNEDFRKNVLDDYGPDAMAKSRKYALALVVIGDNQDELSGECRWVVKALRQRAGICMAQDARVAPIALEIRSRTQEALRNPANHEGAHH